MFGKLRKMVAILVATALVAGSLLPVYGENAAGSTRGNEAGETAGYETGYESGDAAGIEAGDAAGNDSKSAAGDAAGKETGDAVGNDSKSVAWDAAVKETGDAAGDDSKSAAWDAAGIEAGDAAGNDSGSEAGGADGKVTEESKGSTALLKGESVAEGDEWVTFDPSNTTDWVYDEEQYKYIIYGYKGSATKLNFPGRVNNKVLKLQWLDTKCQNVFKDTVKEIRTDYGVTIENPADVFRQTGEKNMEKVDFRGTVFEVIDNSRLVRAFEGHGKLKEASFYDCEFNYSNVDVQLDNVFNGCTSLETVSFNNISFTSSTVTPELHSVESMFYNCSKLETVTLLGFDVSNVADFDDMFRGCKDLQTIYVDHNFAYHDLAGYYITGNDVFTDCTSLKGGNGTTFNENDTDYEYLRIDKDGTPGYLTLLENPPEVVWDEFNLSDWKDPELVSGTPGYAYIVSYNGTGTKLLIPATAKDGNGNEYNINLGRSRGESFEKPAFPNTVKAIKVYGYTVNILTPELLEGSRIKYAEFDSVDFTDNGANAPGNMDMFKNNEHIEYVVFNDCTFRTAGYSGFDEMFRGCTNLRTVVFVNPDFQGVYPSSLKGMFMDCPNLTDVYLKGFNMSTRDTTDFSEMFKNCKSLKHIYVDMYSVPDGRTGITGDDMFSGCTSLEGGLGTKYQAGKDDQRYFCMDSSSASGYLTILGPKWDAPYDWSKIDDEGGGTVTGNLNYKQISNSYSGFGYPRDGSFHIPEARYRAVFGRRGSYVYDMVDDEWGGSCYGMSASSGLFNIAGNGVDTGNYSDYGSSLEDFSLVGHPLDNDPSDDTDEELESDLRKFIEALQISQFDERVQASYCLNTDMDDAVKEIRESRYPVVIGLFSDMGGHALIAYDANEDKDGWGIDVYDCNHPNEKRRITLTRENGSFTGWEYKLGLNADDQEIVWHGTADDENFAFVPYDIYSAVWMDNGAYRDEEWYLPADSDEGEWTEEDERDYQNFIWDKVFQDLYNRDPWTGAEEAAFSDGRVDRSDISQEEADAYYNKGKE